jgi:PAS domain S-box-containing protein
MDFTARLRELSRLPIPDVCDLAMIDLATEDGRLEGVIASSRDPEIGPLVERTRARSPIDPAGEHPVAVALRTGELQLRGAMTDEELARYASSPEHLEVMRKLQYSSAIVVPLVARGRTLGVLSVLRLGMPIPFDRADASLVSDLASRAALAVDNARLFEERLAAETQLQTIIANLAEAITIIDVSGELVYINQAAADLFGYGEAADTMKISVAQMFADFELLDDEGAPFDPALLPGRRVLAGEVAEPVTLMRRHRETGEERWLTIKATVVPDVLTGEPSLAVNVIEDITAVRHAHQAAAFLSEASKVLASSLEFEETLQAVAQAAVPQIADWCAVDLSGDEGAIVSVGLAHVEPDKEPIAAELRARYPQAADAPAGVPNVLQTGQSELYPDIDPAGLEGSALDERHLELLRALEMTSVLIVPMTSGDRTVGAITFVTTGGRRRLGPADRELAEELGRRAGVAVENARVHRERSLIAATLQRSLLPPRLPVVPGITLAARFRAAGEANQVGGDFYDLFPAGDGWLVVIGDVTGKGPDAAAITSLARYTIRTAAMYEPEPVAVISRLNEVLLADGDHQQMCTAACLRVTPAGDGEPIAVELVCAGHPPPYLLRAPGLIEELCRPGPLLGAFRDAAWTPAEISLLPGEGVVLYTDGVTDARGAEGRFGQNRLEEVLRAAAGGEADAVAEALDEALVDFQEGPQRDDVALLVLRATSDGDIGPETSVVAGSSAVQA